MAGAPKGNKNALKHGLYAKKALAPADRVAEMGDGRGVVARRKGEVVEAAEALPMDRGAEARQGLVRAIRYLEDVMDVTYAKLKRAQGEEFTRLANTLSLAATALFNGHRTVAYLMGGINPVDEALKELQALDFEED